MGRIGKDKFTPMLAPNETIDIKTLKYPLLASYKLDGIRCIFKDGQMYSRALKQFPNVQLRKRFEHLARYTLELGLIFDGELLSKSLTFNELSGITRQLDKELPDDLLFYCFDCIVDGDFDESFAHRIGNIKRLEGTNYVEIVKQHIVNITKEINIIYNNAIQWGCDGLILRDPKGRYKFGRGTIK